MRGYVYIHVTSAQIRHGWRVGHRDVFTLQRYLSTKDLSEMDFD